LGAYFLEHGVHDIHINCAADKLSWLVKCFENQNIGFSVFKKAPKTPSKLQILGC